MNRSTTLFGTALVVATMVTLAALAGGAAAATGPDTLQQIDANDTADNGTAANDTVAPGARLAGVVGVQQTEVNGDLDNRTFGLRVANADSDEERAAIIAERQNETQAQLAAQAERLADLRDARANGTLSAAEYRARVATVAAQAADAGRDADQLNRTARGLPEAVRERNNINVSAIERLRSDARNLGGSETAAIARSIGGTNARNPMAGGTRGPMMGSPGADRGPATGPQAGPAGERGGDARGTAGQGVDTQQPRGGQDRTQQSAGSAGTSNSAETAGGDNGRPSDNAGRSNRGTDNAGGNANRP